MKYEPNPLFDGEKFDALIKRMMERVKQRDKREGSILWDANASSAIELQEIYIALDDILVEAFGDSASREFLIRRAAERRVIPFPATHAVLRGIITPPDIDITGRRFSTPNTSLTYIAEGRADDGGGGWKLRCEHLGSEGNQFFGAIVPILGLPPRITTAEITEVLIPAQDEESTESLRQRYFDSFDERAFGGNIRDYLNNVGAIDGVGARKVTPVWNGGGTVLVTILDVLYNPASDVLIDKVQKIIDPTQDHMGLGLAPIGHQVTIRTTDIVTVDIDTEITFASGFFWEALQTQITAAVEAYMLELRRDWEKQDILTPMGLMQNPLIVRTSQIDSRILDVQGVVDVRNTHINGGTANLEIHKYAIPMLGVIKA